MKKISFIIYNLYPGGAERVVSVLANSFVKRGYQVSIIILDNQYIRSYPLLEGICIFQFKGKLPQKKVMRVPFQVLFTRKILKKVNPDIIISFMSEVNIISALSNILSNRKLIISERNDPSRDPENKTVRKVRDFVYSKFNISGFVFQTRDARDYFNEKIQRRSTIIFNPLQPNLPKKYTGQKRKVIVSIGRLASQKNQKLLLEAFSNLSEKFIEYSLEIFGDGELKNELIEKAEELKIQNKFHLKATTPDVLWRVHDASLFVLSSDYEGMSNAMIESIAIGIPTIATDCPVGGAREIIKHGVNGLLTPVGDLKNLTKLMEEVLSSSEISEKMSKNGTELKSLLSEDKIFEEWRNFLNVILGEIK